MSNDSRDDALQRLVSVADELCDAVDNAAADIGGSRPMNDILAELGPAVDAAKTALSPSAPAGEPSSGARVPEMWRCVAQAYLDKCEAHGFDPHDDWREEARAMLAAAPLPAATARTKAPEFVPVDFNDWLRSLPPEDTKAIFARVWDLYDGSPSETPASSESDAPMPKPRSVYEVAKRIMQIEAKAEQDGDWCEAFETICQHANGLARDLEAALQPRPSAPDSLEIARRECESAWRRERDLVRDLEVLSIEKGQLKEQLAAMTMLNREHVRQLNERQAASLPPATTSNERAVDAMREKLLAYESAVSAASQHGDEDDDALLEQTRSGLLEAMRPLLSETQASSPSAVEAVEDEQIAALFRKRDALENPLSADEIDEQIDGLLRKQFAARYRDKLKADMKGKS